MRVILSIEKKQQIPYKIIEGRREYSALHNALNKKLISDVANQHKVLIVVILADASNCYNRIAYPITSLICQSFGVEIEYAMLLFKTIQILKIFLKLSFQLLSSYYTGSKE